MTTEEVIDLLSVVTAYDKRTTGEGEFRAWFDAAERGRWSYDEARDAVQAHYAEETTWLMPGHVTTRIRSQRSEPPRSHALPTATPRSATDEHRRDVVTWFANRFAADREERTTENRRCLSVECPRCGAHPDRACQQTAGHRVRSGYKPIEIPHPQRRAAYRDTEE